MLDLMYEIPTREDIAGITITRPVVLGESKPVIRSKPSQAAA
jgi:ATP-dependent protease Clp ATPase subunit